MTSSPRWEEAVEQWRTRGWTVVHDLVPTEVIDAALDDLWLILPRPAEFHGEAGAEARRVFEAQDPTGFTHIFDGPEEGAAFRGRQFLGHRSFPYPGSGRLSRLAVHPNVVAFARDAIGGDDLRIYQTRVWGKYTGVTNYEQPFHQDRNHSIVPDRMEPGWWNLEGFLYLSDVEEGVAPTEVKGLTEPGSSGRIPDRAAVAAAGRRGSYLAYRPDVWHRGVDLTEPDGARFLMSISFRHAGQEWIGYDNVQPVSTQPEWIRFAEQCTPDELALFGAPPPGHPYWTEDLVDALQARYRGLDVQPWRDALS